VRGRARGFVIVVWGNRDRKGTVASFFQGLAEDTLEPDEVARAKQENRRLLYEMPDGRPMWIHAQEALNERVLDNYETLGIAATIRMARVGDYTLMEEDCWYVLHKFESEWGPPLERQISPDFLSMTWAKGYLAFEKHPSVNRWHVYTPTFTREPKEEPRGYDNRSEGEAGADTPSTSAETVSVVASLESGGVVADTPGLDLPDAEQALRNTLALAEAEVAGGGDRPVVEIYDELLAKNPSWDTA